MEPGTGRVGFVELLTRWSRPRNGQQCDALSWEHAAWVWQQCAEAAEASLKQLQERRFPIMGGPSIPWSAIAPHERQALRNHDQTLERLAQRGGLECTEALAVLLDEPWSSVFKRFTALQARQRIVTVAGLDPQTIAHVVEEMVATVAAHELWAMSPDATTVEAGASTHFAYTVKDWVRRLRGGQ